MPTLLKTNFAHLQEHDEQLPRLGMLAEKYFPDDPNTSLIKQRQFAELLAQLVAARVGLYAAPDEKQYDLLRRLQDQGILPSEIAQLFGEVQRSGNEANHALSGDHGTALVIFEAAEAAIANGQRDMLLAMATGTGKTKTCIALIYRLLKAQRFHRILFLVDRSALGEQRAIKPKRDCQSLATNKYKETSC